VSRTSEYVAPEKIENVLVQSPYVGQAFVHGDSFQNYVVAVIVPDEEPVRHMLASKHPALAKASFSDVCQSAELKGIIHEDIRRVAKENGLHGFEIPKAIHLDHQPFSVDNDILTPTFKLKRQQAKERYEKQLEALYASLPPPNSKL
jgi:long-chain acyl-CoA synthetase